LKEFAILELGANSPTNKPGFNSLSPNSDKNELSLYIITYLFKHSSDKNKGTDHQG